MSEREVDFLIVGGGDAGFSAARTLREEGAKGSITDRQPRPRPAVRPHRGLQGLSRRRQGPRSRPLLGGDDFYADNDVELLTRTSAMKLDPEAHTVSLANKDVLSTASCCSPPARTSAACGIDGSRPRRHPLPARAGQRRQHPQRHRERRARGAGRRLLHRHRGRGDADLARPQVHDRHAGEVALERGFGQTRGRYFQKALTDHGVEVYGGEDVERFEGSDGRVSAVVTKNGNSYPADAVIVGVGVTPDVMLASKAGLEIGERGGVKTDAPWPTSAPDIYAAGDIAEYESVIHGGAPRPHRALGRRRAAGQDRRLLDARPLRSRTTTIPYFSSDLSDWTWMEYVGPAYEWDRGDRPRLGRRRQVHDLLPRRRPPRGRAEASTAPTTSSRPAS